MNELSPRREFAQAQARMYERFRNGGFSLADEISREGLDADIASNLSVLCAYTYDLLSNHIGLDSQAIAPILDGQKILLGPDDRTKILNHVSDVFGFRFLQKNELVTPYQKWMFKLQWNRMYSDAQIYVDGPIVTAIMDSMSIQALETRLGTSFAGTVRPLFAFAHKDAPDHHIKLPAIFLKREEIAIQLGDDEPHDLNVHEWWHVLDYLRQSVVVRLAHTQLRESAYTPQEDWIIRTLSRKLFDPVIASQILTRFAAFEDMIFGFQSPEEHLSPKRYEHNLLLLQTEVCAHIAGKIEESEFGFYTWNGLTDIANSIVRNYTGMGNEDLLSLLEQIVIDHASGNYAFDTNKDSILRQWLVQQNLPDLTSTRRSEWAHEAIRAFLHPDGEFTRMREHTQLQIEQAMTYFLVFAEFRSDAWEALFELADMPFTSWATYITEQMNPKEDHAA